MNQFYGQAMQRANKSNWFDTLNQALDSEGLIESWNFNGGIGYGEAFSYIYQDGSKYGRFISIYRNELGRYERPVTYTC